MLYFTPIELLEESVTLINKQYNYDAILISAEVPEPSTDVCTLAPEFTEHLNHDANSDL